MGPAAIDAGGRNGGSVLGTGVDCGAGMNLKRRHLNESQRAMIAAKIANMHQGQHDNKPANLPVSQTQAAELLNVSERTVRSAKSVQDHGTKELVKAAGPENNFQIRRNCVDDNQQCGIIEI
jgi:hypothetical protein